MTNDVPNALRYWFVFHFFADMVFAIPLLFFPCETTAFFGYTQCIPMLARMVGAALVGIGGTSLLLRNANRDAYKAMLVIKMLWSGTAILGFLATFDKPSLTNLLIFVPFNILWCYWYRRIR